MVLRLSSSPATATATTTPRVPSLQPFLQDVNISSGQKTECLKLLKVVLKNLSDPVKSKEPKYRQLKLDNERIRSKVLPYPAVMDYLMVLGFVQMIDEETGVQVIRIAGNESSSSTTTAIDTELMLKLHHQVQKSLELFSPLASTSASSSSSSSSSGQQEQTNKKMKLNNENLSEKQKARILLEEKERKERDEAKRIRQANVAMLKQDKYVRENDPNWKSGVSAACAKSGSGISTFRDRHGEN